MPKVPSKSTAAIERLLEERRQYEAWLARITAAADAAPEHVRTRVRADYEARLHAVTEELKSHADVARQMVVQRRDALTDLQRKERSAAERLAETELRHAVGEYDESQWSQVHRDASNELVAVRREIQEVEQDIAKLEELDMMMKAKPGTRGAPPPASRPPLRPDDRKRTAPVDELAFLKSVTDDEPNAPSPRRASGSEFQPSEDAANASPDGPLVPSEDEPAAKTLKCRECGTMNLGTEWYCESCGAELAAL